MKHRHRAPQHDQTAVRGAREFRDGALDLGRAGIARMRTRQACTDDGIGLTGVGDLSRIATISDITLLRFLACETSLSR